MVKLSKYHRAKFYFDHVYGIHKKTHIPTFTMPSWLAGQPNSQLSCGLKITKTKSHQVLCKYITRQTDNNIGLLIIRVKQLIKIQKQSSFTVH